MSRRLARLRARMVARRVPFRFTEQVSTVSVVDWDCARQ